MSAFSVWVLELAILDAYGKRIARWEVWEAFNTRDEARAERKERSGRFAERKVPAKFWRIRKYVPRESA